MVERMKSDMTVPRLYVNIGFHGNACDFRSPNRSSCRISDFELCGPWQSDAGSEALRRMPRTSEFRAELTKANRSL